MRTIRRILVGSSIRHVARSCGVGVVALTLACGSAPSLADGRPTPVELADAWNAAAVDLGMDGWDINLTPLSLRSDSATSGIELRVGLDGDAVLDITAGEGLISHVAVVTLNDDRTGSQIPEFTLLLTAVSGTNQDGVLEALVEGARGSTVSDRRPLGSEAVVQAFSLGQLLVLEVQWPQEAE